MYIYLFDLHVDVFARYTRVMLTEFNIKLYADPIAEIFLLL